MEFKGYEAIFDINLIGERTNNSYMGTFRVKTVLSPIEQINADRKYRDLIGPNSLLASEHIRQQAFALSQLSQRIIEAPPFWSNSIIGGGHIVDLNVLNDVLDQSIEAEVEFLENKRKELKERQERLTDMIKNKHIEKDPELEDEEDDKEPDEIEVGDEPSLDNKK